MTAIFVFLVSMVLMAFAYKRGVVSVAQIPAIAFATLLGAQVGTLIAPQRHWKSACYIFIGMAVAVPSILLIDSLIEHTFTLTNVFEVTGSIISGIAVWWFNSVVLRMLRQPPA